MNKRINTAKSFFISLVLLAGLLFISCYTPSPLYGRWNDNSGNSLTFFPDYTFSGSVVGNEDKVIIYSGSYTVIDNVIVFLFKEPETNTINVEWDIRGAMLYLDWTNSDGSMKKLSLAHTAR